MILCTQTAAVAGQGMMLLSCCEILSTPTCLGRDSFLDRQLLQFGIGVQTRFVLSVLNRSVNNLKYRVEVIYIQIGNV